MEVKRREFIKMMAAAASLSAAGVPAGVSGESIFDPAIK